MTVTAARARSGCRCPGRRPRNTNPLSLDHATQHPPHHPRPVTARAPHYLHLQEPSQLQVLFEQTLDLLLSIFNPEGHLDITYLDGAWRVGRDNKGNVFLVEKVARS